MDALSGVGVGKQIHEIASRFPIPFFLERDVKVRRLPEHVEEGPQSEPPRAICLKSDVHPQTVNAGLLNGWRSFRQVRRIEIALQQVIQIHSRLLTLYAHRASE